MKTDHPLLRLALLRVAFAVATLLAMAGSAAAQMEETNPRRADEGDGPHDIQPLLLQPNLLARGHYTNRNSPRDETNYVDIMTAQILENICIFNPRTKDSAGN